MKPIIEPISTEILEAELTDDKFIRTTNYKDNEIFLFSHKNSPNLMKEIGRLREITFRMAGGGTGKETDIDQFDLDEKYPYEQLIVWEPKEKRIIGGYRLLNCNKLSNNDLHDIELATKNLFNLSDKFINEYLPLTIELGRSFVHPDYQTKNAGRKGIFALDNLWDGLAALTIDNPHIKYLFGKVTMYTSFDKWARDLILYFFKKHFKDDDKLITPIKPLPFYHDEKELADVFTEDDYKGDYKILSTKVRERGENIPPLINSYMNLSPTMRGFGTTMNDHFGEVEETGILMTIADIYPSKSKRHRQSYTPGQKRL